MSNSMNVNQGACIYLVPQKMYLKCTLNRKPYPWPPINILSKLAEVWYFYITWVIFQQFSCRGLKPTAFLILELNYWQNLLPLEIFRKWIFVECIFAFAILPPNHKIDFHETLFSDIFVFCCYSWEDVQQGLPKGNRTMVSK